MSFIVNLPDEYRLLSNRDEIGVFKMKRVERKMEVTN
jgi:hypothetical protein